MFIWFELIIEVTCKIPFIREAHIHHFGSKEDLPDEQVHSAVGEQIEVVFFTSELRA